MIAIVRPALVLFAALSAVTGIAYPLAVTGIAKAVFPSQAAGSLIESGGKTVGSVLIGQNFSDPKNFWGRPSATSPMANNAANSGGSNQGPLNPALLDAVKGRIKALKDADPDNKLPIPVDLVTASASGVDPHISVAGANYQAARVAAVRKLPVAQVQALIEQNTEGQMLGFIGEPRVNVLKLNLALAALPG
ncbi:MAG: potassium-transporting ATPase subunit KdpC [Burkholderiales bacterium]